eukprot:TRINITY_DN18329_c0_g1_i1.p1 TRINITY_DN18329_c0_g1~~TRINITY_DN18329_c0_g1_i1.p1  ORF type:complete len:737 (+),score=204.80 TRINITY_DN18329_c0_g1_i1:230-2212(+)
MLLPPEQCLLEFHRPHAAESASDAAEANFEKVLSLLSVPKADEKASKAKEYHNTPPPKSRRMRIRNEPLGARQVSAGRDQTPEKHRRMPAAPGLLSEQESNLSVKAAEPQDSWPVSDSWKKLAAVKAEECASSRGPVEEAIELPAGTPQGGASTRGFNVDAMEFVPSVTSMVPTAPSLTPMESTFFKAMACMLAHCSSPVALPPLLPCMHGSQPDVHGSAPLTSALACSAARQVGAGAAEVGGEDAEAVVKASATEITAVLKSDPALQRTVKALSCMLDHFFQKTVFQSNRYLLGIAEKWLGKRSRDATGPWLKEELEHAIFNLEDFSGLDVRIAALLEKLPSGMAEQLSEVLHPRHLTWDAAKEHWRLTEPPEVRVMVQPKGQSLGHGQGFNVMSFSLSQTIGGGTPESQQRRFHLDQLFRMQHAGIACFQGLDADVDGKEFAEGILGEGYGKACAKAADGNANTIFWDRRSWSLLVSHEHGSAIAVDLLSKEIESFVLRVVCLRPKISDCGDPSILDYVIRAPMLCPLENPAVVACADFAHVGGAESAALVPGLLGLRSAMFDVLGSEVSAPRPQLPNASAAGCGRPKKQLLQELWHPASILSYGLRAAAALSQHSEGYLVTLSDEAAEREFPAGQIMLVAKFQQPSSSDAEHGIARI